MFSHNDSTQLHLIVQDWLINSMGDDPTTMNHLNGCIGNTAKSYKPRI